MKDRGRKDKGMCRYDAVLRTFQESPWGVLKPMSVIGGGGSYVSEERGCLSVPGCSVTGFHEKRSPDHGDIFQSAEAGPLVNNVPCNQRSERYFNRSHIWETRERENAELP